MQEVPEGAPPFLKQPDKPPVSSSDKQAPQAATAAAAAGTADGLASPPLEAVKPQAQAEPSPMQLDEPAGAAGTADAQPLDQAAQVAVAAAEPTALLVPEPSEAVDPPPETKEEPDEGEIVG